MFFVMFLPFLIAGVMARSAGSQSCEKITPVANFNSTMILGTWYEYARYPDYMPARCRSIDVAENINGTIKIVVQQMNLGIEPSGWQVTTANMEHEGPFYTYTYPVDAPTFNKSCTIMSIDYASYFLKGRCETDGPVSVPLYWIMTRTRNPSQSVIDQINQACKEHGLPEPNFFRMDHTNCSTT